MRFIANRRLILVLAGLAWLELSLLPFFSIRQIKPDFFLIFLAFYAFRVHWKHILTLAFLVGLIQDLLTNSFFGLETASYVGGAILLQFLAIRFNQDKLWIELASLFSFSFVTLLLFPLLSFAIQERQHWDEGIVMKPFLIALYTTAVGFVVFSVFEKWLKLVLRTKQYELF